MQEIDPDGLARLLANLWFDQANGQDELVKSKFFSQLSIEARQVLRLELAAFYYQIVHFALCARFGDLLFRARAAEKFDEYVLLASDRLSLSRSSLSIALNQNAECFAGFLRDALGATDGELPNSAVFSASMMTVAKTIANAHPSMNEFIVFMGLSSWFAGCYAPLVRGLATFEVADGSV